MLKGVVFDFDGTIVSSNIDFDALRSKMGETALQRGLSVPDVKLPALEFIEAIAEENLGKKGLEGFLAESRLHIKREELARGLETVPVEGSLELMAELRRQGVKIAIITRNCRQAVENNIRRFKIPCDVLVAREDTPKVKPDEVHLREAVEILGLDRSSVAMVGDHLMDVRCGKNYGAVSCGITGGSRILAEGFRREGADFIFDSIEDVGYLFGIKPLLPGKLPNFLLEYLLARYTVTDSSAFIEGARPGVDCAVFKSSEGYMFAKTDPVTLAGDDPGSYVVDINANDLAVMGGKPEHFLVSLILPEGTLFSGVEDIFARISARCIDYGIDWIGGHTEISSSVNAPVACGTLLGGEMKRGIRRRRPDEGDRLFLVKEIGVEAASIIAASKKDSLKKIFPRDFISGAINSIKDPGISVLRECRLIWDKFDVKILHDPTEGGISTALYEMGELCGCGFVVYRERLAFYPPLLRLAEFFGLNPYGIISSGCLTGIASAGEAAKIERLMKKEGIAFSVIGDVVSGEQGITIDDGGKVSKMPVFTRDEIARL